MVGVHDGAAGFGSQTIEEQTRGDASVVRFTLDVLAACQNECAREFVFCDAVVEVIEGVLEDFLWRDVLDAVAGFVDQGWEAGTSEGSLGSVAVCEVGCWFRGDGVGCRLCW